MINKELSNILKFICTNNKNMYLELCACIFYEINYHVKKSEGKFKESRGIIINELGTWVPLKEMLFS